MTSDELRAIICPICGQTGIVLTPLDTPTLDAYKIELSKPCLRKRIHGRFAKGYRRHGALTRTIRRLTSDEKVFFYEHAIKACGLTRTTAVRANAVLPPPSKGGHLVTHHDAETH